MAAWSMRSSPRTAISRGADTILHRTLGERGTALTARAAGNAALRLGETVLLTIRPEHIHLFDAETGRRL